MNAENRIRKEVEKWFILEPLLFSVWLSHKLVLNSNIRNIRVGYGRIEYNPDFILSLSSQMLQDVLTTEAMRIVLKHPYMRKKENATIAYKASNITLREYLSTKLAMPTAKDIFETDSLNKQYFELYYAKLMEQQTQSSCGSASGSGSQNDQQDSGGQKVEQDDDQNQGSNAQNDPQDDDQDDDQNQDRNAQNDDQDDDQDDDQNQDSNAQDDQQEDDQGSNAQNDTPKEQSKANTENEQVSQYIDENKSGIENTLNWDRDEFQVVSINDKIRMAQQSNSWGHIAGNMVETILATLIPELNYKKLLRHFRASIISNRRLLTRMRPSRRYGFQFMGSKYDFCTKLLFAVDVSASMTNEELRKGFAVINQIFKYGIEQVDVIQFDTVIQGEALTMKKAKKEVKVTGRGGTNFSDVMAYIDRHTDYDGLIVFTDGNAPKPPTPVNKHTKIVWLFNTKTFYELMKSHLSHLGKVAYIN